MELQERVFSFFQTYRGLSFRSMTVFNWLFEATLLGSVLIVILLAARPILRKKVSSRVFLFCWLLVAVRLLLPLSLPNPYMNELRPTLSGDPGARPVADQIRVRTQDALIDLGTPAREKAPEYTVSNFLFDFGRYTSYGWTGKWVLAGYAFGAAGLLAVFLFMNLRFAGRVRKNFVDTLSPEDQDRYEALCRRYRVRPVPVWYADPLATPCVFGFFRPVIALPLTLRREELEMVLAHEICHLRSGDTRWGMARIVCVCAHWFNPLVWAAAHLSRLDMEMACDERATSKMTEQERRQYARTLILSVARRGAPSLPILASGMSMNGRQMKQRIVRIVSNPRIRQRACASLLILAMGLTFISFGTAESHEAGYDLGLDKAQYGFLMDEPYSADLPESGRTPVKLRQVETEEQAREYAGDILLSGGILPALGQEMSVSFRNGIWTAAGSNEWVKPHLGWVLCFREDGTPLGFNTHLGDDKRVNYPFEVKKSIIDHMSEVMDLFFAQIPAETEHARYLSMGDEYDRDFRYYRGACIGSDDEITALFEAALGYSPTRLTYFLDVSAFQSEKEGKYVQNLLAGLEHSVEVPKPAPTAAPFPVVWNKDITLIALDCNEEQPTRPTPQDIPAEEAVRTAIQAVLDGKELTEDQLAMCQLHYGINEYEDGSRSWSVNLWLNEERYWDILVNAADGKVLYVWDQDDGNG